MSPTQEAAMKMALEALKSVQDHRPNDETNAAITALHAALAEQREPVAWVDEQSISWLASRRNKATAHITTRLSAEKSIERPLPLYTFPPKRSATV